MPDNKVNERLSRIRTIDELFSSRPGYTFRPEDIIEYVKSKNYDYNRFKLARDIKFLENDKHIRLKTEFIRPSKGVGRKIKRFGYENQEDSIFQDNLSLDDKLLIKDVLEILQLKGITSLNSFMKFEKRYRKEISKNYSPIITFTKNPSEKKISTKLNNLLSYIRQKKVIKIKMQDRFELSKTTKHTVHPWYLREYNRRWYLFGLEEGNIEHYALDRMLSISRLEKSEYIPADKSMEEILKDVIGINFKKGDPVEDIIIWISYKSSDFVLKKPIHKSMVVIEKDEVEKYVTKNFLNNLPNEEGIFVKMRCIINFELRREMMSFIDNLIVLYPTKLRSEIKEILKKMYENY